MFLAALSGAATVGGLLLVLTSWRPVPVTPATRRTRHQVDDLFLQRSLAACCGLVVVAVVTRWPVAAVGGAAFGWTALGIRDRKRKVTDERRTEAIALWSEMLRDAMSTAQGIEGVLVATSSTAPLAIRPQLERMARRLPNEPLDEVLDDLATDLDHPIGDLVVTALKLASTSGGRQIREVLNNVAASAYSAADSQRRIEVARERPRTAMKYTAIVIAAFVGLLIVFSGEYVAPYRSALGQAVLLFVAGYWGLGFWWMRRMGRADPIERFLAASKSEVHA